MARAGAIEDLEALVVSIPRVPSDEQEDVVSVRHLLFCVTPFCPLQVAECITKLNRAKSIKKSYCLEMRLLRDKEKKGAYECDLKELEVRSAKLEQEIGKARRRRKLFASPTRCDEFKGNDDYLDGASKIQDQTQDTLSRTMNLVEASKEIGQSTLNELEHQQEQIKDISADILIIEDNLTRADKLIRNFTKRMMTDKLIMCFAFLNMCGLVGIIVYCVFTGKGLGTEDEKEDNPDER